jgi:hypothetical protein
MLKKTILIYLVGSKICVKLFFRLNSKCFSKDYDKGKAPFLP